MTSSARSFAKLTPVALALLPLTAAAQPFFSVSTAFDVNTAPVLNQSQSGFGSPQMLSSSFNFPFQEVSGGVTNTVGSAGGTATAIAGPAGLGVGSSVSINNFGSDFPIRVDSKIPPGGGSFFTTPGAAAHMSTENLQFNPLAGASFSAPQTVSLNLSLDGNVTVRDLVRTSLPLHVPSASVTLTVTVSEGYVDPVTHFQNGNFFSGSATFTLQGLSAMVAAGPSAGLLAGYSGGAASITTPNFTVPVGAPVHFEIGFSLVGSAESEGGHDLTFATEFAHTLSFAQSGPVFNLPAGLTADEPGLDLIQNSFVGVPEPSVWGAVAGMGCLGWAVARRRRARRAGLDRRRAV